MTPEERADPIVGRLVEAFSGKLMRIGEFRELLVAGFVAARLEALEEAAKIADDEGNCCVVDGTDRDATAAFAVAAAIRERAK